MAIDEKKFSFHDISVPRWVGMSRARVFTRETFPAVVKGHLIFLFSFQKSRLLKVTCLKKEQAIIEEGPRLVRPKKPKSQK